MQPPVIEAATVLAALLKGGRPVAQLVLSKIKPHDMLDDVDKSIFSVIALKALGGDYTYQDIETAPAMAGDDTQLRIKSVRSHPWTERVLIDDCIPAIQEWNYLRTMKFLAASIHDGIMFNNWDEQATRVAINDMFERSNESIMKGANAAHVSTGLKEAMLTVMGQGTLRGELLGIKRYDDLLNGMRAGELTYFAARPGVGKTAFMLEYTLALARRGKKVTFATTEMNHQQLQSRLLYNMASVSAQEVRERGGVTAQEKTRIINAGKELLKLPIHIYEAAGVPVDDISAYIMAQAARKDVDVIFVDYLQDLAVPSNVRSSDNIEREVAYQSKAMRALCANTQLPVGCGVQLNRQADSNARPSMRDLRGSGQMEMDAWNIVALHQPDQPAPPLGLPWDLECVILKQRDGEQGIVTIKFDKRYGHFRDQTSHYGP